MFALLAIVGIVLLGIYYFLFSKDETSNRPSKVNESNNNPTKIEKIDKKKAVIAPKSMNFKASTKQHSITATAKKEHRLFFHEIGGHVASINTITFSNKGDFVATSSSDGNIRCMPVADIGQPLQHDVHVTVSSAPSSIVFTQNSKRLLVAVDNIVKFFKMPSSSNEHKFELVKDIATGLNSIQKVQVLDVEKWMTVIISGEINNQPHVRALNAKGDILSDLTINEKPNKDKKHRKILPQRVLLVASPDDRFIAITGVAEVEGVGHGDVGIFEVVRRSDGEPAGIALKFVLAGHESEVVAISWNANGKRAMTCCADGSWRFWDTSVRYNDIEQPRLFSGSQKLPGNVLPHSIALIAGSTGPTVALAVGKDIYFCTSGSGEIIEKIEGALGEDVIDMKASADGSVLAFVVNGAKRVSLWKIP